MLVWSRSGRFLVWTFAAILIGAIFIAPLAVILAASLAAQWNGALPSGFTFEHYRAAGSGASGDAVFASLVTGLAASCLALISGTWAALALRAPHVVGGHHLDPGNEYSTPRAGVTAFSFGHADPRIQITVVL